MIEPKRLALWRINEGNALFLQKVINALNDRARVVGRDDHNVNWQVVCHLSTELEAQLVRSPCVQGRDVVTIERSELSNRQLSCMQLSRIAKRTVSR